ncbi:MAG: hypothetical protein KBG20_23000 [Caldilineaceae bacterium]|nr:hypothetical protein [Caldilineaceae bacterium]
MSSDIKEELNSLRKESVTVRLETGGIFIIVSGRLSFMPEDKDRQLSEYYEVHTHGGSVEFAFELSDVRKVVGNEIVLGVG